MNSDALGVPVSIIVAAFGLKPSTVLTIDIGDSSAVLQTSLVLPATDASGGLNVTLPIPSSLQTNALVNVAFTITQIVAVSEALVLSGIICRATVNPGVLEGATLTLRY